MESDQVQNLQSNFHNSPFDVDLHKEEMKLKSELSFWVNQEESMVRQNSKENWLQLGDRNSNFFYRALRCRTARNTINHLISSYGNRINTMEEIRKSTPLFF